LIRRTVAKTLAIGVVVAGLPCGAAAKTEAGPALTTLDFEGIINSGNRKSLTSHGGFDWTGWVIEPYASFLGSTEANNSIAPGAQNEYYLNNLKAFSPNSTTSPEVKIQGTTPFLLDSVDLFSFLVNDSLRTGDTIWNSAKVVKIEGFLEGQRVAGANAVVNLFGAGVEVTSLIHVDLGWTRPVDAVQFTLPGDQNPTSPRFVLDNFAYATAVPLPPALPMLGSAVLGLAAAGRRRRRSAD